MLLFVLNYYFYMRIPSKHQKVLRSAFNEDLAKAREQRKTLQGAKAEHSVVLEKRALKYRETVNSYVAEMVAKGAKEAEIESYLKAARKMYRMFLGL